MDYIEGRIGNEFTLEELARVAAFSPFHFHRLFGAITGETLFQFIQRVRVERAATLLLTNPRRAITEIALDCGFSGSAVFSRAFRGAFGVSPSEWRRSRGKHVTESQIRRNLGKEDRKDGKTQRNQGEAAKDETHYPSEQHRYRRDTMNEVENKGVDIAVLPEMTVAYVRHVGPYKGDSELFQGLWEKLMRWAGPRGLAELPGVRFLIIYHDSPDITDEAKLRTSVCLTVPEETEIDGEIGKMKVPGGKNAIAHFELGPSEYGEAWSWTYGTWLPSSGYQPDERPSYELYPSPNDIGPGGEMRVDIVVPVKPL